MLYKPLQFKCSGHARVHCQVSTQFPLLTWFPTQVFRFRCASKDHQRPTYHSWGIKWLKIYLLPGWLLTCPNWSSNVRSREMTPELWHSLHLIRIPPLPIIFKYRHLHTIFLYSLPTFPHARHLFFVITLLLMIMRRRQQFQFDVLSDRIIELLLLTVVVVVVVV